MQFLLESDNLTDYLVESPPIISYSSPSIKAKIKLFEALGKTAEEQAKFAFEWVRDEIAHTFDTQNPVVSISAEDTLSNGEGICFAKAHLLTSILRGMNIPTGFCYQRVLRKGTVESGYALHGLNAIYLPEKGWFRVDPRGNKPGVNSQFSIEKEQLAYPIHPELGEIDYPNIFVLPLPSVILSMQESANSKELFNKRPERI